MNPELDAAMLLACPTCEAQPGEVCEMVDAQSDPIHFERIEAAAARGVKKPRGDGR